MADYQTLEAHPVQGKLTVNWKWLLCGHGYHYEPWKGVMTQTKDCTEIGGEELERARNRPAVPKTCMRALINLRKTFSLIEMGEGNENK